MGELSRAEKFMGTNMKTEIGRKAVDDVDVSENVFFNFKSVYKTEVCFA